MNKVLISGNVMKGFQVKEVNGKNGKYKMALFTVLTSEKPRTFVPCIAWAGMADFFDKYMSEEGKPIEVIGKWASNVWEKDGQRTQSLEVMVDEVEFVLRSKDASAGSTTEAQNTVPFERGNSSYQAPKEVYAVTQSFAQGNDDDFQQVEMDEDLPF